MRKYFSTAQNKIIFLFFALALILVLRLFVLTVIQHESWDSSANSLSIRGIYTTSPRGNIYDRNGQLLAGNQQIFSVKMSSGNMTNEEINSTATSLIKILEKNGDDYNNNFPIEIIDNEFIFTYDNNITDWLNENNIETDATAEEAFYSLKDKLGIESTDRFEIQAEMQTKYNVYPPISVTSMKFTEQINKENFLSGYGLDKDLTAEETFNELRKKYEIADSVSDNFAMKIMAVRTELKSMGYKKYLPATIATDVSDRTILEVEENSEKLTGVDVISETKRYYPNGQLAAHILGYLGQISSSDASEYESKGYAPSSMIGREGIEGIFESVLKGQDGTSIVRVDAYGNYVETLQEIEAEKGKDIYLTIDADLQKVAEDALERNVKACATGGVFESEFGNVTMSDAPNAKSGAVVALDVESGEVLALANYPSYDPNLFAEGISTKDWESLQSSNPRDSLAATPLYNMATLSAVQPGSTFKPITALAALESGLDPDKLYKDEGHIEMGGRTFGCVAWTNSRSNHGYLNMYEAMQVSCNYYFYDLITNTDWSTEQSMGLDNDMGIDKVLNFAEQFGLGHETGIELAETVVSIPSEEKKIKGLQTSLRYILYANAETYFTEDVYSNEKRLDKDIETIVGWINEDLTYTSMKEEYLPTVGIREDQYENIIQLCLYDYFYQAEWGVGDAFNLSIGQGDHAYTPVQMANYIAALGNNGVRNKVSVIKSIEDEGDNINETVSSVDATEEHISMVLEAMYQVTQNSQSGIAHHYASFPWEVCAKTGTAQKSGKINPPSEVEYIKEHLSSFGDMSWSEVKAEMNRLMENYPSTYTSEDIAVRRAVVNLSDGEITTSDLDKFKDDYDEFAWTVALAPKDDPKIAVACVIPQGATGGNANMVVREIIGQYLKSFSIDEDDFRIQSEIN